jgi:Na+-driven multidrug efflux pump
MDLLVIALSVGIMGLAPIAVLALIGRYLGRKERAAAKAAQRIPNTSAMS